MYFFKLSFAALCTIALATASVVRRDATGVIADLNTVHNALTDLNVAVAEFTGTQAQALEVSMAASTVDADVQQTTTDTNASAAFTSGESSGVSDAALPLVSTCVNGLGALVEKEAMFGTGVARTSVHAQLQGMSVSNDAMWVALLAKIDPAHASPFSNARSTTMSAYTSAIAAFA